MPDVLSAAPPPVLAPAPQSRRVLGVRFDATTYADAAARILAWAQAGESRTVCCSNTHSAVEAQDSPAFAAALERASLNTPDGVPVVWALRHLGLDRAERVYGPDLTLHVLRAAAAADIPVAFYGSSPETLAALAARLPALAPGLDVRALVSPPYRALTDAEDAAYTAEIVASGARILFVGLGCPRQELWCDAHTGHIPAVMMAVGAAFDFHAGRVRQAPPALQRAGLEWAFRLAMEPRRLWRRYARVVPRFMLGFARQMAGHRPA
ncbi:MAG TPA: WecB/TagA/CpsF family glycosyltransferase [Rubricoccaceae bacterium]|jgi:N-acetylglucosaminyldiphosphoundecaprenol N-acetyl-beta-D-mannosaminyltransferase